MQSCDFFLTFIFVNFYLKDSEKNIIIKRLWIKKRVIVKLTQSDACWWKFRLPKSFQYLSSERFRYQFLIFR